MKATNKKSLKRNHRVVVKDFFGIGKNLEQWQLGWNIEHKLEAKSSVSKKIFDYFIEICVNNLVFYYLEDGNFYGIHAEISPTPIFRFKKLDAPFVLGELGFQDTHDYEDGEILYWIDRYSEIWDSVKINGKSLEYVFQNSYIVNIE